MPRMPHIAHLYRRGARAEVKCSVSAPSGRCACPAWKRRFLRAAYCGGTAMSRTHTIQTGECISSVAYRYGFFPSTIWDHPENAELKRLRRDPNVLYADDAVHVPELRVKELDAD